MQGRICYGAQAVISLPCLIRNFDARGAMLELSAAQVLPSTFALIHVSKGLAFDAELKWRDGNRVGVALLNAVELREAVSPEHRQLRRIWSSLTET